MRYSLLELYNPYMLEERQGVIIAPTGFDKTHKVMVALSPRQKRKNLQKRQD
jgi:hypothetical protein